MFAIPFGRMFWKEYRVHRGLWLSLLFVAIGLQYLFSWTVYNTEQRVQAIYFLAQFLVGMYSLGCGAVMFASEREERTSDWLLVMSARPAPTLGAKFAFAVVSTIALQLALALPTIAMTADVSTTTRPSSVYLFVPVGLIVLIWSMLGSLTSRRVLIAVLAIGFWWVVTAVWPALILYNRVFRGHFIATNSESYYSITSALIAAMVLTIDIVLGWKWCQGRYFDGAIVEHLSARLKDWRYSPLRRDVVASRIPRRVEHDQPWKRTWQRLLWAERRRDSIHLLALLTVCGMAAVLAVLALFVRDQIIGFATFVGLLLPMVMGLLSFRSDESRQQLKFLVNRGTSPSAVWLSKQIVWLPRAYWVFAAAFSVCLVFEWFINALFSRPIGIRFDAPTIHLFADYLQHPGAVCWYILLSYCCGQLASILIRRVIIAGVLGAMLHSGCVMWQSAITSLEVPQWWSLGMVAVLMLLITLWQSQRWLQEDESWKRRFQLAAAMIAMPCLLVLAVALYRVQGIAGALPYQSAVQASWDHLVEVQKRPASLEDQQFIQQLSQWRPGETDANAESVEEFIRLLQNNNPKSNPSTSTPTPLEIAGFARAQKAMNDLAMRRIQAGELGPAAEALLANLKLARIHASRMPPYSWDLATTEQEATLESIVNLAGHEGQTATAVDDLRMKMETELAQFPSVKNMIIAGYAEDRNLWVDTSAGELFKTMNDFSTWRVEQVPLTLVGLAWTPWERKRFELLLTRKAQLAFYQAWNLEEQLKSGHIPPFRVADAEMMPLITSTDELARTTFLTQMITHTPPSLIYRRLTMIRAASVRLALLSHRLKHGQLPDRLIELVKDVDYRSVIDPYSGRLFDYYPAFLMTEGTNDTRIRPTSSVDFGVVRNAPENEIATFTLSQLTMPRPDDEQKKIEEFQRSRGIFRIPPAP